LLGLAIAAIATGIAGAQWILSKTMGPFADSLKGFTDLDGAALIKTGLGMSAIGVGLTAMGAGGVINAVGNLVGAGFEALGNLLGVKGPLERLREFGEAGKTIDAEGVKSTAEAMAAFSKAMALGGASTAITGIGTLVGGIASALGKLFGAKDPLTQLKTFGATKINSAGVKANAEAMSAFAKAMKDAPEVKGKRTGGLFGFVAGLFAGSVKMPWDQVKLFAEAKLGDTANLKKNAEAMSAFGNAMSTMPEKVEGTRGGGLLGAIAYIFKGKITMPWDQVKLFAEADLGDTANLKKNAEAMSAFGTAMSSMPDKEIKGEKVGGIFGAVGFIFTGVTKMPWDRVKDFAGADLGDTANLKKNAEAMSAFGNAMSTMPEIKGEKVGGIFGAVGLIFTGVTKMPWDRVKDFSVADLGETTSLVANADKLKLFGVAMKDMPEIVPSSTAGGIFGWLAKAFVGDVTYPWTQVKTFANADLGEAASLVANADKLKLFGDAMEDMPAIVPSTTAGGVFGWLAKAFVGDVTYPWDQVSAFANANLGEATSLIANAGKLKLFGVAMEDMPAIVPSTTTGGVFGWLAKAFVGDVTYPWTQVKAFADAVLGEAAKLTANADKLKLFGVAMESMPAIVPTTQTGGFFGWIASGFTAKTVYPWDQVKAFAEADMGDTTNLASNAIAMAAFSEAMTGIKPVEGTTGSGGWLGKISNFFTGAETMPWDQVKIFGGIEINAEGVIKNAKAMSAFAQSLGTVDGDKLKDNVNNIGDIKSGSWTGLTTALTGFQAIDSTALDAAGASLTKLTTPITALAEALPKDIKSRLLGFGSGLEELADYINDGELKTIGKLAEHLEKINLLGPIFDGGLTKDPNQLVKPATQPSRIGQSGWASTGSPGGTTTAAGTAATATADLVNAENSTIAVNADMLTSANNRETILGEIKVLLQELNTTTKDAKTKSEKSAVKLKNAVAATNPYMGI
jgi:hypothetical protein